jgi:signal transduction histidine kinase
MPFVRRQRIFDLAPTVVLVVIGTLQIAFAYHSAGFRGPRPASIVFLLAVSAPLVVRRRRPGGVLAAVVLVMAGWLAAYYAGTDQPPFEPFAAGVVASFALGLHADGAQLRTGLVAFAIVLVASAISLAAAGVPVGDAVSVPVWWLAAVGIGRVLRERQALVDLLQERSLRLERERERDMAEAAFEERARIARELHDVIAHAVSIIVVQARAERRMLDQTDRQRTEETLETIENSGRDALGELRRLLGVLRARGSERLAPQPGLGTLPELLDDSRHAGQSVRFEVEGDPVQLKPGLSLAAYRIVQEALTNARKHAPAAAVDLTLRWRTDELEIDVVNEADASGNGTVERAGHGLIGMRERAALFGGDVRAERGLDGSFRVRACLPLSPEEAA